MGFVGVDNPERFYDDATLLSSIQFFITNSLSTKRQQEHEAGDTFIRTAASVISCIFPENAYRIGGDEFVIVVTDMEQQEYLDKVAILQENMKKQQVSTSIGFLWKDTCDDLEELLKEADQHMYEAKKLYYQTADRRTHDR